MSMPAHTSTLTLGGGGIGQVWGETDRAEAVATVQAAWEGGITLFDNAPLYGDGEAETVLGLAFDGNYPDTCAVTSKCMLGNLAIEQCYEKLESSLDGSLQRLQRNFVDIFFLHGYIVADDWQVPEKHAQRLRQVTTPWRQYVEGFVPAMESFIADGRIRRWGITAVTRDTCLQALAHEKSPPVVQCITNPLDSAGSMTIAGIAEEPREIMVAAKAANAGVMGIRAVAAGALADSLDRQVHPRSAEALDFERAAAFRNYAANSGESAASLAHRYALSLPWVDTVVLGVKNRDELRECLSAAERPRLGDEEMNRIARLFE